MGSHQGGALVRRELVSEGVGNGDGDWRGLPGDTSVLIWLREVREQLHS